MYPCCGHGGQRAAGTEHARQEPSSLFPILTHLLPKTHSVAQPSLAVLPGHCPAWCLSPFCGFHANFCTVTQQNFAAHQLTCCPLRSCPCENSTSSSAGSSQGHTLLYLLTSPPCSPWPQRQARFQEKPQEYVKPDQLCSHELGSLSASPFSHRCVPSNGEAWRDLLQAAPAQRQLQHSLPFQSLFWRWIAAPSSISSASKQAMQALFLARGQHTAMNE